MIPGIRMKRDSWQDQENRGNGRCGLTFIKHLLFAREDGKHFHTI